MSNLKFKANVKKEKNNFFKKSILILIAVSAVAYVGADYYTQYTRDNHIHTLIIDSMNKSAHDSWVNKRNNLIADLEKDNDRGFISNEFLVILKKQESNEQKELLTNIKDKVADAVTSTVEITGNKIDSVANTTEKLVDNTESTLVNMSDKIKSLRTDNLLDNESVNDLTNYLNKVADKKIDPQVALFLGNELVLKNSITLNGEELKLSNEEKEEIKKLYSNIDESILEKHSLGSVIKDQVKTKLGL